MGVNFFLFRVRSPIGPGGVSTDRVRELTEGLTFGTPQEVKRRLREANVFGMGTGSPDEPDRTDFTSLSTLLAGKAPFVDPRTGEPLSMPKDEGATFTTDDGRLVNISLSGDPVEHITFYKSSPRDVIEVVDALPDLGPFGILRDDGERILAPEEYRPRRPTVIANALFAPLSPAENPFPDRRGLRWVVKMATCCTSDSPVAVLGARVFVPAGAALAALDVDSGGVAWTRAWNSGRMLATVTPHAIVIAGDAPNVYGLAPSSGEILWELGIKGRVTSRPTPISDTSVAFGTEAGCLYAVDSSSGRVLWWANWIPGPLYTRLACAGNHVIASSHDHARGLIYAFDNPPGARPAAVHYVEGHEMHGGNFCIPSMLSVAGVASSVFVMSVFDVIRLTLPELDDVIAVEKYSWDTGFERFMVPLNDGILAYAISTGTRQGVIRAIDAATLDRRYEISLSHTPSEAVVLDERRFAFVARPFRRDTAAEGKLVIAEIGTGTILEEKALGFHSWQDAYVSGQGRLLCTCTSADRKNWSSPGTHFLACWDAA